MKNNLWRAATALLAALVLSTPAVAKDRDTLAFDATPGSPILTLTRVHGMVRGVTDAPLVRVYGDGLVHVHVPAYMKGAGHYQYRLDSDALNALLKDLSAHGLMDFDATAVRSQRDAAAQARRASTGERFVTLDSTVTRIDLNFARFAPGGSDGAALKRTIEWADAGIDAERYPQVRALAGLAAAEKALLSLTSHAQRRPVKAPAGE